MSEQTTQAADPQAPVPEQAPGTQQPATPELTIQDLSNLRAIIDVASQRGAFRSAEFSAIGATFNKLNDFLNAVAPQQPAEGAEAPAA
jgi:hypothetical protein